MTLMINNKMVSIKTTFSDNLSFLLPQVSPLTKHWYSWKGDDSNDVFYTLEEVPTTESALYSAPNVSSELSIISASAEHIILSNNLSEYFSRNSEGDIEA